MRELHNEYTNAFSRIDLESCFYKNAFWLNYLNAQCADSQEGQEHRRALLASNGFNPENHEKGKS